MPKPFDAASKYLFEADPVAWLAFFGIEPGGLVSVVDTDLSTVTSDADKVIRIDAAEPWLVHVEVQAGYDADLARRLLRYNVLLETKYGLPVHSVAVLLRPEANVPSLQGVYERRPPVRNAGLRFEYQIIRLWQQPVGPILEAGLGTLPLAPVCDVPREDLPDVLARLAVRFRDEMPEPLGANLWVAARTLMELRYTRDEIDELVRGVHAMIMGIRGIEASSYYQEILTVGKAEGKAEGRAEGRIEGRVEGRMEEVRRTILRLGRVRYGEPTAAQATAIETITDLGRAEATVDRILAAESWSDVLAGS